MLPLADATAREEMTDMLSALRAKAASILDAWMDVDEAIEETYAELFNDEPADTRKGETFLRKGLGFYDLAMFEEASTALAIAVEHDDLPATRIYLALSQLAAGHVTEAWGELKLARLQSSDPLVLQAILEAETQVCVARKDWQATIHALYQLLSTDAPRGNLWFNLGVCHVHLFEFAAAGRCFTQAHAANPRDTEALLWCGLTMAWTERVDEAKWVAQLAESGTVRNRQEVQLQVLLYLAVGEFAAARRTATKFGLNMVCEAIGLRLLALCDLAWEQPERAVLLCKKAMTLEPDHGTIKLLLGMALFLQGDTHRADLVLSHGEDHFPFDTAFIHLLRGRIALMHGHLPGARRHFTAISDTAYPAVRGIAALYEGLLSLRENDVKQATDAFAKAIHLGVAENVVEMAKTMSTHDAL